MRLRYIAALAAFVAWLVLVAPASPREARARGRSALDRRAAAPAALLQALQRSRAYHIAALRARRSFGPTQSIAADTFEVTSATVDLAVANTAGTLSSSTRLVVRALTGTVAEVHLRQPLVGSGAVVSDAQGALSPVVLGSDVLRVPLRAPLAAGQSVELRVVASGMPRCAPSAGVRPCNVSAAMTYTVVGRWQALAIDSVSGAMLLPRSAELSVTAPRSLAVVASGEPLGVVNNADQTDTHRFRNNVNGRFAVALASYDVGQRTFDGSKPLSSYTTGGGTTKASQWRDAAAAIIADHAGHYGPYDGPKLDLAQIPDSAGVAFGPYSAVFLPATMLSSLPPGHWIGTPILAHELAHQWFGNIIELADWTAPWLNEGLASYAEMRYTAARASADLSSARGAACRLCPAVEQSTDYDYGLIYRSLWRQWIVYGVPAASDVPLSSSGLRQASASVYYALTYIKGAFIAIMLRELLGSDAAFDKAMQRYRADHAGKSGATVASFAASIKAASGIDITAFLNAWTTQAGYPSYKLDVKRSREGAAHVLTLTASADRDFAAAETVEIVSADGTRARHRLAGSGTRKTLTVKGAVEPVFVRFDPDRRLLCRARSTLDGDVVVDGDVDGIDLIHAAWAVGKTPEVGKQAREVYPEWADLDANGRVDDKDLARVTANFGKSSSGGAP